MRTLNQSYFIPTVLMLIGILTLLSTPSLADGHKYKGDYKFKKSHPAHEVNYRQGHKHHAQNKKHHHVQNKRYKHHNSHNRHHQNRHNYHVPSYYGHHVYKHYDNHNHHYYRSNHNSDRFRILMGLHLRSLDIYLSD